MTKPLICAVALAFVSVSAVPAQTVSNPLSAGQKMLFNGVRNNLERAAEKMPEENYSFKPVPEVFTFAQMLTHIIDSQYAYCSIALGEKAPAPMDKSKTSKADIVQGLKQAFAYCDKAYDGMTDSAASEIVKFYNREQPKLTVLTFNISHSNEHYGNIVTYLRIKGLVPPSSERR